MPWPEETCPKVKSPHPGPLPEGEGDLCGALPDADRPLPRAMPEARRPHPNPLPEGEGTTRPHPNPLPEGEGTICIGRLPDNDVVLDYPNVSGRHARIVFEDGRPWLEDCGSRNGTAVGSPEKRIERARLSPDDAVYFGTLRVHAARLLAGGLALGSQPYTALKVGGQVTILGRAKKCDIVLDDPRVSRRHARLVRAGGHVDHRRPGHVRLARSSTASGSPRRRRSARATWWPSAITPSSSRPTATSNSATTGATWPSRPGA